MDLYWVETDDHHEDWFVVANVPHEAEEFFESYEGYDEDTAVATLVCSLKGIELEIESDSECGSNWASNELLISLGAEIQNHDEARVVRLLGNTYAEGMLESIIRTCDEIRALAKYDKS